VVDNLSVLKRSKVMSSIRGKNTKPEIVIRKLLWSRGKRYRIHDRSVEGIPDISNKRKKVAVFIDGCFWHGCETCYKEPTTNVDFWRNKIARNRTRRSIVTAKLRSEGWTILEFWEHDVLLSPNRVSIQIVGHL
jgi:DNA mismatch endonuclease (patch repair protein)